MIFRIITDFVGSAVPPTKIGLVGRPRECFYAGVGVKHPDLPRAAFSDARAGCPDPNSAWCDGQHAVGTGGVIVASEARESRVEELCDRGQVDGSTTSIVLLLRSARKYLLSTGSNQLMSNEKNVLGLRWFPIPVLFTRKRS